jgi:hypothetical protein
MPQKRTSEKEIVVSAAGTGTAPSRSRRKASPPATRAKRPAETPATAALPAAPANPATESVVVVETVAATPDCQPGHEEIAALAYALWEGRGYQGGSPEEDWLHAEEELRARTTRAASA